MQQHSDKENHTTGPQEAEDKTKILPEDENTEILREDNNEAEEKTDVLSENEDTTEATEILPSPEQAQAQYLAMDKRRAAATAAGIGLAGAALGSAVAAGAVDSTGDPVQVDTDQDGVADSTLSDENQDGIYETFTPTEAEAESSTEPAPEPTPEPTPEPGFVDMDDSLSFSQAFAGARAELGPGGTFEWRGQIYGTYYHNEVDENYNPIVGHNEEGLAQADLDQDGKIDAHYEDADGDGYFDTRYDVDETTGDIAGQADAPGNPHNSSGSSSNSSTASTTASEPTSPESNTSQTTQTTTQEEVTAQQDEVTPQNTASTGANDPNVLGVDTDQDGVVDAAYVDLNHDGSADLEVVEANYDGQLDENDQVNAIHDPESLDYSGPVANPSEMSVDSDGDGVDDVVIADMDNDQIVDAAASDLNGDGQLTGEEVVYLDEPTDPASHNVQQVDYHGETADDIPEVMPEEDYLANEADSYNDDIADAGEGYDDAADFVV